MKPHDHNHLHPPGLSLIELLIALSVTSVLLTATMVAINASFIAYASSAEQASTQAATRMIVHRILTLIRTSVAHGPLVPDAGANPPVTLAGNTVTSNYIELIDPTGRFMRVEYRAADEQLWLLIDENDDFIFAADEPAQPLLSGVTNAVFFADRRLNDDGLWVLDRATIDLTAVPPDDATLDLERGPAQPVRMVASTTPRKLE